MIIFKEEFFFENHERNDIDVSFSSWVHWSLKLILFLDDEGEWGLINVKMCVKKIQINLLLFQDSYSPAVAYDIVSAKWAV